MKATISYKVFEEHVVKTVLDELNIQNIHKKSFINHYLTKLSFTVEDNEQLNQVMYCLNRNTRYGVFLLKVHWTWRDISKMMQEVFKNV